MSEGIPLKCEECGHEWAYTGDKPRGAYTNCSNRDCRYKVKIPRKTHDSEP